MLFREASLLRRQFFGGGRDMDGEEEEDDIHLANGQQIPSRDSSFLWHPEADSDASGEPLPSVDDAPAILAAEAAAGQQPRYWLRQRSRAPPPHPSS